jgi:hypothetical protein
LAEALLEVEDKARREAKCEEAKCEEAKGEEAKVQGIAKGGENQRSASTSFFKTMKLLVESFVRAQGC